MEFTVTPEGGEPFDVKAESRDVLVWERTSKDKSASFVKLMSEMRMVDLYRLAHIASRRQGLFNGTLQEFEETCELEFTEPDVGEVDPTRPAR